MEKLCTINPVWLILFVNVVAAFLVPFLTYRYAHKNNLKILREKWISEFRSSTAAYLEACLNFYYANDVRCRKFVFGNELSESERAGHERRCEEGQSRVTAASSKIRLLFKKGDADFIRLEPLLEAFRKSIDELTQAESLCYMDPKPRNDAQDAFLKECNSILSVEWSKIAS